MNFGLECKKVRRTGFTLSFLGGGLLAAMIPVLNMTARSEMYLGLPDSPVRILMDANWQMMSMLNILLIVAGACLMYHIEYADNAVQRIRMLPMREYNLYLGKMVLMVLMCVVVLAIETAGTNFCISHWFQISAGAKAAGAAGAAGAVWTVRTIWTELLKNFGYALVLMLPAVLCSLLIASVCKSMWVSLGIGVVCVFTATMLPTDNFALSLFPFAMPFQIFAGTARDTVFHFMSAAVIEVVLMGIAEILFLRVRRSLE